jgi:hypothetical protein
MTPQEHEIVEEGKEIEKDLKDGVDDAIQRGVAFLIRQQRTQMFSEFVTDKECKGRMAMCPGAKPVVQKPSFSRAQAVAWLGSVLMGCSTLLGAIHLVVTK